MVFFYLYTNSFGLSKKESPKLSLFAIEFIITDLYL